MLLRIKTLLHLCQPHGCTSCVPQCSYSLRRGKKHPSVLWHLLSSLLNSGAGFVSHHQCQRLRLEGGVSPSTEPEDAPQYLSWTLRMGRRKGKWSTAQAAHHCTAKTEEAKHELWQSEGTLPCIGKARHVQHTAHVYDHTPITLFLHPP